MISIRNSGDAPLRIRARDLLPRSEQHGLVPQLPLLRGVDRLKHELAVVHLLGGLGVEGDSVHDRFEILCEELSEESDFVEVRRHDMEVGAGNAIGLCDRLEPSGGRVQGLILK